MSRDDLLTQIEQKRTEMIFTAAKHGLCSAPALKRSQELDRLLNQYSQYTLKSKLQTANSFL